MLENPENEIKIAQPYMPPRETLLPALEKVLYSGWIGEGPVTKQLERKLCEYFQHHSVLPVNSGTAALWMAYNLAGIKRGSEVLSTPMTCSATNIPLLHFGARIKWCDIKPSDGNIDPKEIRRKITPKTKAIVTVDYAGTPCDYQEINEIAEQHQIPVIDDAAQAIGATYRGKKIGAGVTDYACFSLQAIKTITCVDGGILSMRYPDQLSLAKRIRWFGIDRDEKLRMKKGWEYLIHEPGYKFQTNDVLATIAVHALDHLEELVKRQRENAAYYDKELSGALGVTTYPITDSCKESNHWLYFIGVPNRDAFMQEMRKMGVATSPVHYRNDYQPIFSKFKTQLPVLDGFNDLQVCIPNGYWVGEKERECVVEAVKDAAKKTLG